MSRGLGEIQRRTLELLGSPLPDGGRRWQWTIVQLTFAIHGEGFTDSQRRGVARAVSTLAARGLVDTQLSARRHRHAQAERAVPVYLDDNGEWHYVTHTEQLWIPIPEVLVRLPCTCGLIKKRPDHETHKTQTLQQRQTESARQTANP